jgi:SpoVK/Ycf46/Vps4 family AAA+-type ATPase
MAQGDPAEIYLAADAKSIMTEHQKARRNRQRDINSFADIMHHHHEKALTAGILLVNLAEQFDSPLRNPDDITDHVHIDRIVGEIIEMFDSINRSEGEISANLDGAGVVVVDHTNLIDDIDETELVTDPPAPQEGDRVHYRTFVSQMASWFEDRFI